MFIALLITNALLGIPFLLIGGMKLFSSPAQLLKTFQVEGPQALRMRLIGLAEILGTIGLFAPILTGVLTWLTPTAAAGLLIIMILAIRIHRSRGESISINLVLAALSIASIVLSVIVIAG